MAHKRRYNEKKWREKEIENYSELACPRTGKLAFETKQGAKKFARRVQRMGGELLSTYLCERCGLYHNGHLDKKIKRGDVGRQNYYTR